MKKIYSTLTLVLWVACAYAAQLPTIGTLVNSKVNKGIKTSQLIVNGISDNDLAQVQNVTMNVSSSNTAILSVTGILYTSGDQLALINVMEFGIAGVVTLTVSAMDADGTTQKSFIVQVDNFYPKGVLYSIYDIVFWQKRWITTEKSTKDTILQSFRAIDDANFYCNLGLTAGPSLTPDYANAPCDNNASCGYACFQKDDGFTMGFKGYILPTITGVYTFYITSGNDFRIDIGDRNTTATSSMSSLQDIARSPNYTTVSGGALYNTTLIGGKQYIFSMNAYPVFTKDQMLEWAGPGFSRRVLDGNDIMPFLDTLAPSKPSGIEPIALGSSIFKFKFRKAPKADQIKNYIIYLNGQQYKVTTDTVHLFAGLQAANFYTIGVKSVDALGNESLMSDVTRFTTYPVDATAPIAPTSVVADVVSDLSALISWSGSSDVGSEILGYNVYINGAKHNTDIITATNYSCSILKPKTNYAIQVEAIDASYNVSATKSSTLNIATRSFDAMSNAPGVKKAAITIDENVVGRHEGFGINLDQKSFYYGTKEGATLRRRASTVMLREGGFTHNGKGYQIATSPDLPWYENAQGNETWSMHKQLLESVNSYNYASVMTGLQDTTDWFLAPEETGRRMMEFIAGPPESPEGMRRVECGRTAPYLPFLRGLIVELGSETWGGRCKGAGCFVNHNSPFGPGELGYKKYGEWGRKVAAGIKGSPYYDPAKVFITYSGREPFPTDSYGLHEDLYENDNGMVDWLAPGGYLGGNLTYVPDIEKGETDLDYFKNGWAAVQRRLIGFDLTNDLILARSTKNKLTPFFLYETNFSSSDFNGRLGQAVVHQDYINTALKKGVVLPCIFYLDGGEWAIVDVTNNRAPLAAYTMLKLNNENTIGNILNSKVTSREIVKSGTGLVIQDFEPVGHSVTVDSTGRYSVSLFSRDFENDMQVMLDFPKDMQVVDGSMKQVVIGGPSPSSRAFTTTTSALVYSDSMIVTVPKYSYVLITFRGKNLHQKKAPLGYSVYRKITSIKINAPQGKLIDVNEGKLTLSANVTKNSRSINSLVWTVIGGDDKELLSYVPEGDTVIDLFGNGNCSGNGKFRVRLGTSDNDPLVYDEVEIDVTNQGSDCPTRISKDKEVQFTVMPNPAVDKVVVSCSSPIVSIQVLDQSGRVIVHKSGDSTKVMSLSIKDVPTGINFIKVISKESSATKKLVKH